MGWLGTTQVAAHQIALNLASITFMVPLGLSSAAAVVVGHAVGRTDPVGARGAAQAALACAVTFMGTTALAFTLAPRTFAGLYTARSSGAGARGAAPPVGRVLSSLRRNSGHLYWNPARTGRHSHSDDHRVARLLGDRFAGKPVARLPCRAGAGRALVGARRSVSSSSPCSSWIG